MKSSGEVPKLTIGQLAGQFGLGTHVLRHWESVGLLTPAARVNGRRRYYHQHVVRIVMILRGKAAGLSLEQLWEVFTASNREERRTILTQQYAELTRRIAQAHASQRLLEHVMDCQADDFTQCAGFQNLIDVLAGSDPLRIPTAMPDV